MKRVDDKSGQATFRCLCVCVLSVLLVSVAARADAVLEWNKIAVDIAVANQQNPFAQGAVELGLVVRYGRE